MYYVPWWLLAACLPVAGLAAYLALRGAGIPRVALYALTVLLAPVLLLGTAFVAVIASTALSMFLDPPAQAPTQPVRSEMSAPETTPEPTNPTTVPEETMPEPTSPAASPSASPAASSASASASASASPAAGN